MTARRDLLLEVDTTLDGSGNYNSPWIDSAGTDRIVAVWTDGISGVKINFSLDTEEFLYTIDAARLTEYVVPARYFNLRVIAGGNNAAFRASVRALGCR